MRCLTATSRGPRPKISTLPLVGLNQAQQKFQRRGFARTVGANQTENFAAPHVNGEFMERDFARARKKRADRFCSNRAFE